MFLVTLIYLLHSFNKSFSKVLICIYMYENVALTINMYIVTNYLWIINC